MLLHITRKSWRIWMSINSIKISKIPTMKIKWCKYRKYFYEIFYKSPTVFHFHLIFGLGTTEIKICFVLIFFVFPDFFENYSSNSLPENTPEVEIWSTFSTIKVSSEFRCTNENTHYWKNNAFIAPFRI